MLSHWDTDDWAGAVKHIGLLSQTWVVPRQVISPSHTVFANSIRAAGGNILVIGHGAGPIVWSNVHQEFELARAKGFGRNGSGLVFFVKDLPSGRTWVLTGDAGYDVIPHSAPSDVAAMAAPHHGADMGPSSVSYIRSSSPYAHLFIHSSVTTAMGRGGPLWDIPWRKVLPVILDGAMVAGTRAYLASA